MAHPESLVDEVLDRRDRYRALAADWNCGYLDLDTEWIDTDLLTGYDPAALARDAWLPLHHDDEGYVLVVTAAEPTPERVATIEAAVGAPVCVAVTSDWDIEDAIRRAYPPPEPARPTAGRWIVAVAALLVLGLALTFATVPTLLTIAMLICAGYLAGIWATVDDRLGDETTVLLHPLAVFRDAAARRAAGLLLTPPLYVLSVAVLLLPAERVLPAWSLGAVLASLLAGQAALVYADLLDAFRRGDGAGPAFLGPVRWLLHAVAAYRGLGRLLTRPRDREKARHDHRTVHSGDPEVAAVEPG